MIPLVLIVLIVPTALLVLPNLPRAFAVIRRSQVLNLAWEMIDDPASREPADLFCARAFGVAMRCVAWLLAAFVCGVGFLLTFVLPGSPTVIIGIVMLIVALAFAVAVPALEQRSEDCEEGFEELTGLDAFDAAARVRRGARRGAA